jgi:beta-phosphoglucomutase family hydrolase
LARDASLLPIPRGLAVAKPRAFIFDMDGTIADSMPFHERAWQAWMVEQGVQAKVDDEFFHWTAGRTNAEIFPKLLGHACEPEQVAQWSARKEAIYQDISQATLLPIAGFEAFADAAIAAGKAMAVGTAAPPSNIAHILDRLDLRRRFSVIVGAADIRRGKPDPEVFLTGAKLLGVAPEHCAVFEDAPLGIEAAFRAGMQCVVVKTALNQDQVSALANSSHVLFCVDDFHDSRLTALL